MSRKYTAQEMRELAGQIEYDRSVDYYPNVVKIAGMLRQAADILDCIQKEIDRIEKMPTANLDGSFANQKINGERLMAKIAFFQNVKKIVEEASNE